MRELTPAISVVDVPNVHMAICGCCGVHSIGVKHVRVGWAIRDGAFSEGATTALAMCVRCRVQLAEKLEASL